MNNLLQKLSQAHQISQEELVSLLKNNDVNKQLFQLADKTRIENVGDEIHLRGLIEFSNTCKNPCLYCGLRRENRNIERYNLSEQEIINIAKIAKSLGYKTVVLQSGENNCYPTETMQFIIKEIKKLNLAITLSLGEKTFEEYEAYKLAGANRYLLRIETTDKNLYQEMHPNMSYENRLKCLDYLKTLNYEVGSGFLVGLPNQTLDSIANDLLFLKDIKIDMAGIGPFIPHKDTPLRNCKSDNNFNLALKSMALMRLLLPDINIPATTAMEVLNQNGRIIALNSGANVIMPNVTDAIYRQKYQLYPGKTFEDKSAKENFENAKILITNINRTISTNYGCSKAWKLKQV